MLKCTSLVLKVASRCNLNCSYCYMYNLGDSTYKNQPKVMSDQVVEAIIAKTRKHCVDHNIKDFSFTFHGGEPLLCGKEFFQKFVDKTYAAFLPDIIPFFSLQTNSVLLDDEWSRFFVENDINVSFSIDGYKELNDRHRVYHNGKGSFDDIIKGINTYRAIQPKDYTAGVLSVMNIDSDQKQLLEFYRENGFHFDVLLPDSNYIQRPYKKEAFDDTRYGEWLCELFDLWYDQYSDIHIRFFVSIISNLLGKNVSTDAYGTGMNEIMVIETDGSIEAVDVLKICGDGFTKNNMNIIKDELDDAFTLELVKSYAYANESLPTKCKTCNIKDICGGGYLPHRFSEENQFDNPSIYCHDFAKLITHVQNRIVQDFPEELLSEIDIYSYEDFLTDYQ